jgi:hypothetical protein
MIITQDRPREQKLQAQENGKRSNRGRAVNNADYSTAKLRLAMHVYIKNVD